MPGRVFVAIELPVAVRDILTLSTSAFVDADPLWAQEKLVAPCLLHVTLAFLGAVPDETLGAVIRRIRDVATSHPPFELRISGVCAVPSARQASMVWATLDGDIRAVARLAESVAAAAHLPATGRPFRAHVTLARARRSRYVTPEAVAAATAELSACGKDPVGSMSVRSVTVFSSTTGHGGPAYEPLAHLRLGDGLPQAGE